MSINLKREKFCSVNKLDLKNVKYDYNVLKENIYALDFFEILDTQFLSTDFVVKYILNKKYQMTTEEEKINIEYVLNKQSHLKREDILCTIEKIYNNYDSDNDSFIDFNSYSLERDV